MPGFIGRSIDLHYGSACPFSFSSIRQSLLFVLVRRKERGWLVSKGAERNSRKKKDSKSMPGSTLSWFSAQRTEYVSSCSIFPSFQAFQTRHETLGSFSHAKGSTRSIPSDRIAIAFSLFARLFSHFLYLATSLANRRSIFTSMPRSRAPTSFPWFVSSLLRIYTELDLLYPLSCFTLTGKKQARSFFVPSKHFESWNCPFIFRTSAKLEFDPMFQFSIRNKQQRRSDVSQEREQTRG